MAEPMVAVRHTLVNDGSVSGLVGTRIYQGKAPTNAATPYIVLHLISDPRGMTHDGPDGLNTMRVQADTVASSIETAQELGAYTRIALNGLNGSTLGPDSNQEIRGLRLVDERGPTWDGQAELYVKMQDYRGIHRDQAWST